MTEKTDNAPSIPIIKPDGTEERTITPVKDGMVDTAINELGAVVLSAEKIAVIKKADLRAKQNIQQ